MVTSSVPTISPAGRRLPRIWDAAKAAWMDLYRVFRNLPRVWAVALAINFGFSVPAPLTHGNVSAGAWILTLLLAIAEAFLLTPYSIAVHRLIILDETAQSYVLRPREPRFQKFFGWSLILSAGMILLVFVFGLPLAFLLQVLALTGANVFGIGIGMSFILSCALIFTFPWAMARLSILFPAIAVDAAGANWRNVMADTRGYAWQIFLIALLAFVPVLVIESVFAVGSGTVVTAVIDSVVGIVSRTLLVVIASRLYQRLGNRVNQPRGGVS